ncbi:MAG: hypothetical protein AMXMBFR20_13560 [Planctomycetia bacterium]|nr:MAG: hypothetical protein B6D36_10715 [Planctomycetes bacterium UTPLA1]
MGMAGWLSGAALDGAMLDRSLTVAALINTGFGWGWRAGCLGLRSMGAMLDRFLTVAALINAGLG